MKILPSCHLVAALVWRKISVPFPFQNLRKMDVSARWAILLSYDFPYHLVCRGITVSIFRSRKINMLLFFFFFAFISILLLVQLVTCGFKRNKY